MYYPHNLHFLAVSPRKFPAPDKSLHGLTAMWNFGRGMAYAATGKQAEAEAERKNMDAAIKLVPKDVTFGLNPASAGLAIAERMLDARIYEAREERKRAVTSLQEAARIDRFTGLR